MSTTQQNRLLSISTPLEEDFLLLNRLTATEEISALFEYEVELLHEEDAPGFEATPIDAKKLLGQAVGITITQRDGTIRNLSGMITHFSQGHRDIRFSLLRDHRSIRLAFDADQPEPHFSTYQRSRYSEKDFRGI